MTTTTLRLHALLAAVCPIDGVSGSQGGVRIDFRPEATAQQRADAQAVLASFDWSPSAHAAWEEDRHPERKTLREQAAGAIADNDTFLAIASPNNAQTLAQVRKLTQQNNRIIKRLIQLD